MASPHPTEGRCLYLDCGGPITDIWTEFLGLPAERAAVSLGKADFTCPYCGRPLSFNSRTNRIEAANGRDVILYQYAAAVRRARYENTSIFGLMRGKMMLHEAQPAFLQYQFADRSTPLTEEEGEQVHSELEADS